MLLDHDVLADREPESRLLASWRGREHPLYLCGFGIINSSVAFTCSLVSARRIRYARRWLCTLRSSLKKSAVRWLLPWLWSQLDRFVRHRYRLLHSIAEAVSTEAVSMVAGSTVGGMAAGGTVVGVTITITMAGAAGAGVSGLARGWRGACLSLLRLPLLPLPLSALRVRLSVLRLWLSALRVLTVGASGRLRSHPVFEPVSI